MKIPIDLILAILVDGTGSSNAFSAGILLTVEAILRQIEPRVRSITVTLIKHGDLECGEPHVLITDRGSAEQALADLRRLVYGGGGDAPETHLDAIENALRTVAWPDNPARARGAMVTFTTADTKPNRSGLSARALGAEIFQRGLLYYHVGEPTPTLQELVDGAHGIMLPISNEPDPESLQQVAAKLSASITGTLSSGKTEPMPVSA